jgi:ribose 1,5-bisphosphate isomerase
MNIRPEIEALINAVRNDKVHGASELARQSVNILKLAAEQSPCSNTTQFKEELEEIGWSLMSARPAMASIYNIVNRLLLAINQNQTPDVEDLRRVTIAVAENLLQASTQAVRQIALNTVDLLTSNETIMTHSYSSTIEFALKMAAEKAPLQTIVTRSGAGRTGEKMARNLSRYPVSLVFIDDTAVGLYISRVNKVIVGADRFCADGSLVNGAGTYLLALAAREACVPFYVLCETLKFDTLLSGTEVDLEEKDPSEVVAPGILPDQVKVKNPCFDITPLALIAGIVTENGLIPQKDVLSELRR